MPGFWIPGLHSVTSCRNAPGMTPVGGGLLIHGVIPDQQCSAKRWTADPGPMRVGTLHGLPGLRRFALRCARDDAGGVVDG